MTQTNQPTVIIRPPTPADGLAMWELVRRSGGLDLNSPYAYLMASRNWQATCTLAQAGGDLAGMVMAYCLPDRPDTLFVWQVGVDPAFRGRGLGVAMLSNLAAKLGNAIRFLETTITPSNRASQALFRSFARDMNAPVAISPWVSSHDFPDNHEGEDLFRIGPFPQKGMPQ